MNLMFYNVLSILIFFKQAEFLEERLNVLKVVAMILLLVGVVLVCPVACLELRQLRPGGRKSINMKAAALAVAACSAWAAQ